MAEPLADKAESPAHSGPLWDPALGRERRKPYVPHPFERLDAPYRVRRAIGNGALAAWMLAFSNGALGLVRLGSAGPGVRALIGDDPQLHACAELGAAALAGLLAVRFKRRPSVILAWVILMWTVAELTVVTPLLLYGHGFGGRQLTAIACIAVGCAIWGLRGARAMRALP